MKKLMVMFMSIIMVIGLTACGNEDNTSATTSNSATTNAVESPESTETPQKSKTKSSSENAGKVFNVDNCKQLKKMLSKKAESDPSYSAFADKYKDSTIEFDASIDAISDHGDDDNKFDILLSAGKYSMTSQKGPTFKFENVGVSDLDLDTLYLKDVIKVGEMVHVSAEVDSFNADKQIFYLIPQKVTVK